MPSIFVRRFGGLPRALAVLFLAFLPFAGIAGPASAQTLQAILVADTSDPSIGVSVKKDFENLKRVLQAVSGYTGMKLELQAFEGAQVTLANVRAAVNAIKPGTNDTVFFYYSGHGYRTFNKTSRFPYLYISQQGQDFTEIVAALRKKTPRLLIAVTDSCNNLADFPVAAAMAMRSMSAPPDYKKTYSRLWLDAKGEIVIASSSEGEYAWGDDDVGGYFTKRFLESHESQVNVTGPTATPGWESVVNAAKGVINVNYGTTAYKQTPVVEAKLSYVRAYVPAGAPVLVPAPAPAPTPVAAVAPKLAWVRLNQGAARPATALVAGQEGGQPVGICRAPYQNGIHPGKLLGNNGCSIGYGGREVVIPQYEVLTGNPQTTKWVAATNGAAAPGAYVAGGEPGRPRLVVCRGPLPNGSVVAGKLVAQYCNVSGMGREFQAPRYEVLVAQ